MKYTISLKGKVDTSTVRQNIASVLHKQGKSEEALAIYDEIYETWKEKCRESILVVQNNKALLLVDMGKYKETQPIFEEVYGIKKALFGYRSSININDSQ